MERYKYADRVREKIIYIYIYIYIYICMYGETERMGSDNKDIKK